MPDKQLNRNLKLFFVLHFYLINLFGEVCTIITILNFFGLKKTGNFEDTCAQNCMKDDFGNCQSI
jgi:hypothetical protein